MLFSVSKGIHSLSENSSIPPDGHILEILSLEEALGRVPGTAGRTGTEADPGRDSPVLQSGRLCRTAFSAPW